MAHELFALCAIETCSVQTTGRTGTFPLKFGGCCDLYQQGRNDRPASPLLCRTNFITLASDAYRQRRTI